jgi:hypothetical protein
MSSPRLVALATPPADLETAFITDLEQFLADWQQGNETLRQQLSLEARRRIWEFAVSLFRAAGVGPAQARPGAYKPISPTQAAMHTRSCRRLQRLWAAPQTGGCASLPASQAACLPVPACRGRLHLGDDIVPPHTQEPLVPSRYHFGHCKMVPWGCLPLICTNLHPG